MPFSSHGMAAAKEVPASVVTYKRPPTNSTYEGAGALKSHPQQSRTY